MRVQPQYENTPILKSVVLSWPTFRTHKQPATMSHHPSGPQSVLRFSTATINDCIQWKIITKYL